MWIVKYKPDNESQPWSTLDNYYSSEGAIARAICASIEYFMVIVTDPEGSIIWSN